MLRLNDDCLYEVFKYLSLSDQITVARVCSRFMHIIVNYIFRRKFKTLYSRDPGLAALDCKDFQFLFRLAAVHAKSLTLAETSINKFISHFGRYVQPYKQHFPELHFYFSLELGNLSEFKCLDERFNNGYMRLLASKCKQLRVLHVHSPHITGEHVVDMLDTLEELQLSRCDEEHLQVILRNSKQLKTLKLNDMNLTFGTFSILLNELPTTVRTLVIRDAWAVGLAIAEQNNLTSLTVIDQFSTSFTFDDQTITVKRDTNFVRIKNDLTTLEISSYQCGGIIDITLMACLIYMLGSPDEQDSSPGIRSLKLLKLIEEYKNLKILILPLRVLTSFSYMELFTDLIAQKRSLRFILSYLIGEDVHRAIFKSVLNSSEVFKEQTFLTVNYSLVTDETRYVKYTFTP